MNPKPGEVYLADSGRSVILDQVTSGLAVRMAVLHLCAGANPLKP